jgi:NADH-quinone oxidoreductase subunit E
MLTKDILDEIEHEAGLYETRQAACIDALKIVQKHHRWVNDEAVGDIARVLGMSPDAVDSVASFYNGIYRRPVGKHVILVCNSVSCWVMGYETLRAGLQAKLGIQLGQTTADGRFTLLPIQCLGDCDNAPSMMIGEDMHPKVEVAQLDAILARYS